MSTTASKTIFFSFSVSKSCPFVIDTYFQHEPHPSRSVVMSRKAVGHFLRAINSGPKDGPRFIDKVFEKSLSRCIHHKERFQIMRQSNC